MNRKDYLRVCLVEPNPLALNFLLGILKEDSTIQVLSLETLSGSGGARSSAIVFLLDNCGLPLPLSEYLRRLRFRWPDSKSMVLDRELNKGEIFRLLWFGIDGYVSYSNVPAILLQAVHSVAQGNVWAPREVLHEFVHCSKGPNRKMLESPENVTFRECQIIELIKRRLSNKEIADILGIRESTVKFHLSNIYSKLQVTNRFDLLEKNATFSALDRLILNLSPVKG